MQIAPEIVVVGGILLLLPTGRLVSSVQDAINGFPVTAAGRFLSTMLTFGALVAGIAVGFVVGDMTGMEPIDVTKTFPPAYDLWVVVILIAIAVLMIGITEQTSWKLLLPTAAVGVVGYLVLIGGDALGIGSRFAPALAAVVIGLLARVVALRMGAPQLVVAVPGRADPAPRTHHIPVHVCIDHRGIGDSHGRRRACSTPGPSCSVSRPASCSATPWRGP